jgi:type VI protein secretion system component VasK
LSCVGQWVWSFISILAAPITVAFAVTLQELSANASWENLTPKIFLLLLILLGAYIADRKEKQ